MLEEKSHQLDPMKMPFRSEGFKFEKDLFTSKKKKNTKQRYFIPRMDSSENDIMKKEM